MSGLRSQTMLVTLLGQSVEVAWHHLPSAAETILLLHEALGSVSYWKDFPQKLALAAGVNVLLYSRAGHGNSAGPLAERNRQGYLREAEVVMPALLAHFRVDRPIVYGHSEGANLAILYAATTQQAKALILESPFVIAKESSREWILNMAANYQGSDLQERLAKYHQDADAVFTSWITGAEGLRKDESPLREFIPRIKCPVLLLQGADDEFGITEHRDALLAVLPQLQHQTFAGAGHLPHRQQTDALLERVSRFVNTTVTATSS